MDPYVQMALQEASYSAPNIYTVVSFAGDELALVSKCDTRDEAETWASTCKTLGDTHTYIILNNSILS